VTMLRLILREIKYRKMNFLLSLLAVVMAVALFVSFFTTGQASKRETIRLMRDMGFNLRIIPGGTDMNRFWTMGFSDRTMPEEYIYRLASQRNLSYAHLTAILQRKVTWRGREAILTGISPEVSPPGRRKPPMSFTVGRGTVYVGFELARELGLERGDTVDIFGRPFTVERCLPESGSDDDIRIYEHLRDVQDLLGMAGRINEIRALECVCSTGDSGRSSLAVLREQLARLLPEARVIRIRSIATARERQRRMVERYLAFIMPVVLIVCIVWIGTLAMINVHERRREIGIMRALGYGSAEIASLFLGKAALVGALGAVLGFGLGTALSLLYGPDIFKVTANMVKPVYGLLGWSFIVGPALAALSSFIPAMFAVTQDPAITLRGE